MVIASIILRSDLWWVGLLPCVQGMVHMGALFMAPMDGGYRWLPLDIVGS